MLTLKPSRALAPHRGRLPERKLSAMTLCLAAVCDSGNSITCVFDKQLTTDESMADVMSKAVRVNASWLLMFAGNDVSQAGLIIDRLKKTLLPKSNVSLTTAQHDVQLAYSEVCVECIEVSVLPPGWTYEAFRAEGLRKMGEERFHDLSLQASSLRLGLDFLLAGFDERGLAHVVCMVERQPPKNCDRHGYGSLGSGALVAEHLLAFTKYATKLSEQSAVYHLCAAKFFAESAYVGLKTHIAVFRKTGELLKSDGAVIRALWAREGMPRIPDDLNAKMPALVPIGPTPFALPGSSGPATKPVPKSPKRGRTRRPPSLE